MDLTIIEPSNLKSITDFIHDCFFDLDKIVFNQTQETLRIFFVKNRDESFLSGVLSLPGKNRNSDEDYCLTIYNVSSYKITDTEKIGLYDFNKLNYDSASNELLMSTGVPVDIRIKVNDFKISLSQME